MRWLIAPLIGALAFTVSGFLGALEDTTKASAELAAASEEAPQTTREALEEIDDLPAIADVTGRQALAFRGLANALQASSERVEALGDSLDEQLEGLDRLSGAISSARPAIACVESRLRDLLESSQRSPEALRELGKIMIGLIAAQEKSIRHLKSINRKLTALGVVATATDVKPPPPPGDAPPPRPGPAPSPLDC